ncbi:hypothetical protein GF380_00460, partial [Candidatus Uhrbacteria bacterium]|nr:hypothetical protein [Candidatus Uhrbacteria bacterium]MBD3284671.1 hypothetical protein [Candidatus Uhrbacteria bacterium]
MPPKKKTTTKKTSASKKTEEPVLEQPKPMYHSSSSKQPTVGRSYLVLIIVIAMGLTAAYLLIKGVSVTKSSIEQPAEPQLDTKEQLEAHVDSLIDRVKRHILVNEEESPYVATISNIDLVRSRNPIFYKDAKNGDKVLIWSDKALVYSPELDKLVAVTTAFPPD